MKKFPECEICERSEGLNKQYKEPIYAVIDAIEWAWPQERY